MVVFTEKRCIADHNNMIPAAMLPNYVVLSSPLASQILAALSSTVRMALWMQSLIETPS